MVDLHVKKLLESDLYRFLPEASSFSNLEELTPSESNRVIVTTDETKENKRTMYAYENSKWVYLGIVAEMPVELIITRDRNLYISDKDRKPMKLGDLLCYDTYNDLVNTNPAIQNKLYLILQTSELYYYSSGIYKKISGGDGGSSGGGSTGIIFTTLNDLNNYLLDVSRMSGMLATCLENEGVLYILSNDKSSWLTVETGITETFTYLFNSELW